MRHPLLALWLCAACNPPLPFEPAGPGAAPDPSTFGPFKVGVRTMTFTDVTRINPRTNAPRKLVTEIWYPAEDNGGEKEEYELIDALPPEFAAEYGLSVLGSLPTEAVRDADFQSARAPYPLVVFSHGNGGVRMQSTFLTVALASHGYVVASPDHEDNTLADLLEGGVDQIADPFLKSYIERPQDMKVLIDRLTTLDVEDPLHGKIDFAKIGIAGHSLGAVTSLRTASIDPRIKAVVAEAPAGYLVTAIDLPRTFDSLRIPIQVQGGLQDKILPGDVHAQTLWDHLARPRYELILKTAGHFTFSDLCVIDRGALEILATQGLDARSALNDGCGPTDLDAATAGRVLRLYGIGMFNAYLRSSPDSLEYLDEDRGLAFGADLTFRSER